MDCQTARQLLPYLNPRAEPLPAELASSLEAHAGQCDFCSTQLQTSGREDRVIALAMRDVDIPEGLQQRLLGRLRRERIKRRRNWPVHHPRWAAAAALFLCLSATAGVFWWQRPLPTIDMIALENSAQESGSEKQVAILFAERGWHVAPPRVFRYNFLVSCGWELFQGKIVPRLLFEGNNGQIAEVFILSTKAFNTAGSEASGNFALFQDPSDENTWYLVRSTGASPNWVFNPSPNGA